MGDRAVHYVGSLPGEDAGSAMSGALATSGPKLRTLADGETGERNRWIVNFVDSLDGHPDLEMLAKGTWSSYKDIPKYRIRKGRALTGDALNLTYVDEFRRSYPVFKKLREEHRHEGLRYQVGVPGPLDLAMFVFGPIGPFKHVEPFHDATVREIRQIHAEAGDDVLFQIEVPVELVFMTKAPKLVHGLLSRWLAKKVVAVAAGAPEGTSFGVHLCLGDLNNKALGKMKSAAPLVTLSNAIAAAWPAGRKLEYVHAPLAMGDLPPSPDESYYRALSKLALPPGCRFIAGLAHENQDLDTQRRLLALVERLVNDSVDIACACGLGRRTADQAAKAMARCNELAQTG
ncbi:hypothetical protein [Allokutzneria albata]|uniref:Cobalamin-independent synthase, Catalytic domain n=1 Tax=Allokutzneria albata TaxID=211114 RepID=A0A1G9RL11_ALLAB|nr:hypothetical protein [Allokutzneria albata]SDM23982.1 hypothetical protein SAMN04489726_0534 [Allokutzneria albata]